jgi:hypothetical protein
MRYYHKDVAQIAQFIEDNNLNLFHPDSEGKEVPRPVNLISLEDYLRNTQQLWGSFPETYFIVTHESRCSPISVDEAMKQAEAQASSIAFVLVGYNDGGVVSISNRKLPFQDQTHALANWEPIGPSKPKKLATTVDRFIAFLSGRSRRDSRSGH